MARGDIAFHDLSLRSCHLWDVQWLLLTSGDFAAKEFNTMTVSWGSLGTMWDRPFAQVVVRPSRYTFEFIERFDSFTLCAFPERLRDALRFLGTRSGRDMDKITMSGLTLRASHRVASPSFEEAELIIECRKIYTDDFDPARFLDPAIHEKYPKKDYHRIYYGEILAIHGEPHFRASNGDSGVPR